MGVFPKIFLALLVYLFIEIFVFVEVSFRIGFFYSALLLIVFSAAGYLITKRVKINASKNTLTDYVNGMPLSKSLLKIISYYIAGLFFLIPGFVTDGIAILFLIPYLNYLMLYGIFKYLKSQFKDFIIYGFKNNPGVF